MVLDIVLYGNPALRKPALPVKEVTGEIRELAKDMLETMHANKGLGLAAEQVGRSESICVIDVPPVEDETGALLDENPDVEVPLVLINPEIVERHGEMVGQEGCLSFPEIFATVPRSSSVKVSFLDLEGKPRVVEAKGLLARAIQHERDHLAGVLLVDRMSAVKRVAVSGRLKRLRKDGMAQKV